MKPKLLLIAITLTFMACNQNKAYSDEIETPLEFDEMQTTYTLPSPSTKGDISIEEALSQRRSHRDYQDRAISASSLSQILWAAYGITQPKEGYAFMRGGLRTAPSAGARYPLEIYVLVGKVKGIEPGVYKYISKGHKIKRVFEKDLRPELCAAALDQEMIKDAPAVLFYSAVFSRTTSQYGKRGHDRFVCMDLGHSAQNVYLQVESLNMGTCAIGAFDDDKVRQVMQLPEEEEPLYIMPVGYYYEKSEF